MTISLQFLGAARHVTGTKHLLTVNGKQVLLDCGMVQGPRQISDKANRELPLDPTKLHAVVLSHAHIDHSGSLPRLVKLGFRGAIWCTPATHSLTSVLLADSAHIQASDARHLHKRGQVFVPFYDEADVQATLRLVRTKPYSESFEVCPEVRVTFHDAGHIIGSAMVELEVDDGQHQVRIVFTGDHGRKGYPILRDPVRMPECDYLITESTYGNRLHEATVDIESMLAEIVKQEIHDGGRILIPAFSVGRTQNVVLHLGRLMDQKRIPRVPIWVDSPLSKEATRIMSQHPDAFDDQTQAILKAGKNPFFFDGVRYVADAEESKSLNSVRQGVIISASGMCEAGRILHHLSHSVSRSEDCVLLVGYQAQGTMGRKLLDRYEHVKIFGERYAVRCKVRSMPGLSAHADYQELLNNQEHLVSRVDTVFVVHGEEEATAAYADKLEDAGFGKVAVPVRMQKFILRE